MKLPNGEEWTEAKLELTTLEDAVYDRDGNPHDVTTGWIIFYTGLGPSYKLYIADEWVDVIKKDESANNGEYKFESEYVEFIRTDYYVNNISGNAIVLKQSEFNTLSSVFPGGYEGNFASESTYYIANGEVIQFLNEEY